MINLARDLVSMAVSMGAQYAEGRVVDQSQQAINGTDGAAGVSEFTTCGFGIRVLVDGQWGFASDNLTQQQPSETVRSAISLARAMPRRTRTVRLAELPPVQAVHETQCEQDPFKMPVGEKVDMVHAIMQAMAGASDKVSKTQAKLDFRRETSQLVTSEGTEIGQTITLTGAGLAVTVSDRGQVFRRTYPYSHTDFGTGGFELVQALKPIEAAATIVHEAVELLDAPPCGDVVSTVILDPTLVGMVLHETMGHPIEMDRALGDESDNFGPSFLQVHHLGEFQYASELVNMVADATRPKAVATYGYDHEGVKAQSIPIIKGGVFSNYLMSRECATELELPSNGTARASSWNRIPMVRITNLSLVPGDSTREQLISETDDGLYIETFKGGDIDDKRLTFSFMGERGWQIRGGKIVGLVKNPVIYGEAPVFWRNCSGIAGPDEDRVVGISSCGKGLPWQFIPTGQGGPPARFDQVKVGGGIG
ncbi:MAG: TldD/PmbA family protein [Caldilineaceae bacterium]|nr:TldD/PmbA family protein [Caldilineaceae bacterium]